jgi:hypothetical protein
VLPYDFIYFYKLFLYYTGPPSIGVEPPYILLGVPPSIFTPPPFKA